MAVARVQSIGQRSGQQSSLMVAFPSPTTAGNLIGVAVASYNPDVTHSISDNKGNTYPSVVLQASPDEGNQPYRCQIFYSKNILGGSSHEVTLTPSSDAWLDLAVVEYSGCDPTNPVEEFDSGTGSGAGPATNPSLTLAGNGAILAIITPGYFNQGFSPGSGWNEIFEHEDVNDQPCSVIDRLVAAGSYTPTWGVNQPTVHWASCAVAFREASAAPIFPHQVFRRRRRRSLI